MMMKEWILISLLGVYSYEDVRNKGVPILWLVVGLLISFVCGKEDILRCSLPGIGLCVLASVFKGKLGYADGFFFAIIGNMLGVKNGLSVYVIALVIASIYGCFLLFFGKKNKDYCFAFAPCCFLGAAIFVFVSGF